MHTHRHTDIFAWIQTFITPPPTPKKCQFFSYSSWSMHISVQHIGSERYIREESGRGVTQCAFCAPGNIYFNVTMVWILHPSAGQKTEIAWAMFPKKSNNTYNSAHGFPYKSGYSDWSGIFARLVQLTLFCTLGSVGVLLYIQLSCICWVFNRNFYIFFFRTFP